MHVCPYCGCVAIGMSVGVVLRTTEGGGKCALLFVLMSSQNSREDIYNIFYNGLQS